MKVDITIPRSLNDITLEQYQKYLEIENPKDIDLLTCMLDQPKEVLINLKTADFERLTNEINKLFEAKTKLTQTFSLNGLDFGLIPNLDEITYGENKDVTKYLKGWSTMHKAMAVLFREVKQKQGKKYLIEPYNGTAKLSETMREMPLDIVLGVFVFFWNLTNELLNCIPNYLEKETENLPLSFKNGEIMKNLLHSLKATLGDITKLQTYPFTRV